MFGIGFFEIVVIAIVALVFVGPQRLPEFMKQVGRFFVHMRRTANDVRSTFDHVVREAEDEIRREEAQTTKALLSGTKDAKPTTEQPAVGTATQSEDKSSHVANHEHTPEGSRSYAPEGSSTRETQTTNWGDVATPEPVVPPMAAADSGATKSKDS